MILKLGKIAAFWNRPTECWKCGSHSHLEACHIIPKMLGGSDKVDNLVILCNPPDWTSAGSCHAYAPDVNDSEYMWEYINDKEWMMFKTYAPDFNALAEYAKETNRHDEISAKQKEIMDTDDFQEWWLDNVGQHGLKEQPFREVLTTWNWIMRKKFNPILMNNEF